MTILGIADLVTTTCSLRAVCVVVVCLVVLWYICQFYRATVLHSTNLNASIVL